MPHPDPHALLALHNAVQNASTEPTDDTALLAILRGEGGPTTHVRTVFEDVSLQSLFRAGAAHGIDTPTILAAYAAARPGLALANPELDAALKPGW